MKSIFDPSFRYSPSYGTDVRKTFERVRREQAGYTHESAPSLELARKNVLPMPVRQEGKK
ncbi:MAG TPA: hypothetical protein VGP97_13345 [Burkholderiales bacterium]|jgi:hypothetical protein|nr:hypothetical protein [Burkholderiales bacterium]